MTTEVFFTAIVDLTRIIHEFPIPKQNYLQSREMLEIFTPQNWDNNYSCKNLCASPIYWYFDFS